MRQRLASFLLEQTEALIRDTLGRFAREGRLHDALATSCVLGGSPADTRMMGKARAKRH